MTGYLEEYFPLVVFLGLSLAFGLILMLAPLVAAGEVRVKDQILFMLSFLWRRLCSCCVQVVLTPLASRSCTCTTKNCDT